MFIFKQKKSSKEAYTPNYIQWTYYKQLNNVWVFRIRTVTVKRINISTFRKFMNSPASFNTHCNCKIISKWKLNENKNLRSNISFVSRNELKIDPSGWRKNIKFLWSCHDCHHPILIYIKNGDVYHLVLTRIYPSDP